jgi:hypothetical protein
MNTPFPPSPAAPKGAGGTPGGIGSFLLGTAMVVAGGYLLLQQVTVTGGGFRLWGFDGFGLSLLPLLAGIAWLFFDGKAFGGWALTAIGAIIIVVGIIANLSIYFQPTSLFDTLMILGLLFGGIGLVARSLRAQPTG